MNKHTIYGLTKATMVCYRLLVSLGMNHDSAMSQLKLHHDSNKRIAEALNNDHRMH